MSEPSKWTIVAASRITDRVVEDAQIIQEAIDAALEEKDKRLSSLQAIMEQLDHDGNEAGCFKDCPRCAYQKLLEEWK